MGHDIAAPSFAMLTHPQCEAIHHASLEILLVYGAGMHHLDIKTMTAVYGGPEFQLARVAVAEMGRCYGMPTWGYAGDSDSCVMDEQAAAESMFSTLVALLAGNKLTHDVGYLEQGMTTSPEMMVFTAKIIAELRRFMDGISLDDESLAMEALHQEGPRGHFLTSEHTLRNFRILPLQPAAWRAVGQQGKQAPTRAVARQDCGHCQGPQTTAPA